MKAFQFSQLAFSYCLSTAMNILLLCVPIFFAFGMAPCPVLMSSTDIKLISASAQNLQNVDEMGPKVLGGFLRILSLGIT